MLLSSALAFWLHCCDGYVFATASILINKSYCLTHTNTLNYDRDLHGRIDPHFSTLHRTQLKWGQAGRQQRACERRGSRSHSCLLHNDPGRIFTCNTNKARWTLSLSLSLSLSIFVCVFFFRGRMTRLWRRWKCSETILSALPWCNKSPSSVKSTTPTRSAFFWGPHRPDSSTFCKLLSLGSYQSPGMAAPATVPPKISDKNKNKQNKI